MKVVNKKARFDYKLLDRMEAGIVLTGAETKSAKSGQIKLEESFVRLSDDGAYLVNTHIAPYKYADSRDYNPQQTRKLLLHKKEILSLAKKMEGRSLTLVPTAAYTKKGKVKIEIALAEGKKKWDKRRDIKKRDQQREAERDLRQKP